MHQGFCWLDRPDLPVRPNDVVESLHVGLAGLRSGVEAVQLGSSEGRCSVKDAHLDRRILHSTCCVKLSISFSFIIRLGLKFLLAQRSRKSVCTCNKQLFDFRVQFVRMDHYGSLWQFPSPSSPLAIRLAGHQQL